MKNLWKKHPLICVVSTALIFFIIGAIVGSSITNALIGKPTSLNQTAITSTSAFIGSPTFTKHGVYICKNPGWKNCRFFGPGNYNLRFCNFDPALGDTNSLKEIPEKGYHVTLFRGPEFTETDNSKYQIDGEWVHSDVLKVKDNSQNGIPDPPTTPC